MKKSISNIQRNSSPSLSMKGPTTPYRSTQMKATSFTAKQQGSTSASPWWTSSRNASGYLKECLRRHWKKRVKTRVSLASLGPPQVLPAHPSDQPPLRPHAPSTTLVSSRPRYATVICSCSICFGSTHCIWTPRVRMLNPETAFPADDRSTPLPILIPHLLLRVPIQKAL